MIPTYTGKGMRRRLARRYGPPVQDPRPGDFLFGRLSRVRFDDERADGRPVAYWIPEDWLDQDPRRVPGLTRALRATRVIVK
jgi:hypothetical protein